MTMTTESSKNSATTLSHEFLWIPRTYLVECLLLNAWCVKS